MTGPARRIAATLVAAATLLLSACFVSPGSFTSAIDLRKDGRFSYSYAGEIYLLGLSNLAEMGRKSKWNEPFKAEPCHKDDIDMTERTCSEDEIAQQKADWEENRKADTERQKRDAEMMKVMLGGIDPSNPQAAEELAARLRKQAGWRSVVYKGDGLFVVDFAISGRLDHDFQFPTMERFPMANTFVVLNKRADGSVRMDAPAFGQPGQNNPMANFAQFAAMGTGKSGDDEAMPKLPELNGTLVLTTDGAILANNTDDGPAATTTGQRLEWKVTPRLATTPTALVRLGS
jgi:predicted nucleic acid-binding Zn ribbon protein